MQRTNGFRFAHLAVYCLVAALAAAAARPAGAFDFAVTKVADTAVACETDDCSLREAILAANAFPGQDTITVPPGLYILTIIGQGENGALTGDLDITDDLVIEGSGAAGTIVFANGIDRVFEMLTTSSILISDLTVQGGMLATADPDTAFSGGGIQAHDAGLTLRDCVVTGNTADGVGGGIVTDTALILERTTVSNNTTTDGVGGGIAVAAGGSASLTASAVIDNHAFGNGTLLAGDGGGIWLFTNNSVSLFDSTVSGNTAEGAGGGIFIFGGTVHLTRSTVSGNTAAEDGGGIDIPDDNVDGSLEVINSTVSGNTAGVLGGGIRRGFDATLSVESSTVGDNIAAVGQDLYLEVFGAGTATDTVFDGSCSGPGSFSSASGNIESPGDTCLLGAGNQVGVSAAALDLGPLADNGGPTLTHRPLLGSVAIDTASDCPGPSEDQRGLPRPVDGDGTGGAACDVGAVEVQIPAVPVFGDGFESGDTSAWSEAVP